MPHKHIAYLLALLLLSLSLFTHAQTPLPGQDLVLSGDIANDHPKGIWSDRNPASPSGTGTIWVIDQDALTDDINIFAYDLSTGIRDTTKEFDLDSANANPKDMWSNARVNPSGETDIMWVTDSGTQTVFAYDISDIDNGNVSREAARDITLHEDALRARDNDGPRGIWGRITGTPTIWVADINASKIFAYDLSTGDPVPDQDINLAAGNGAPQGMWGGTTTTGTPIIWVVDNNQNRLYAYNLNTGDPVPDQNIDLDSLNNDSPEGIWSDGTTMWVADSDSRGSRLFAYPLEGMGTTRTRAMDSEFDLYIVPFSPQGIWSNTTTMWLSDDRLDRIFAYNLSTRMRDSAKEFNLVATNDTPQGMWGGTTTTGTPTLWVADVLGSRIYTYDLSTRMPSDPNQDIVLDPANSTPRGIWSNSETLWVADSGTQTVFAYTLSTGARDVDSMAKEFKLDSANDNPRGMWSDGTTLWVADESEEQIYAYTLSTGDPDGNRGFKLDPANMTPSGIWSDGETMWVVDNGATQIFAYTLPVAPMLTPVSLAGVPITDPDATIIIPTMEDAATGDRVPVDLEYIFEIDQSASISYAGACTSSSPTSGSIVTAGTRTTVIFDPLAEGTHTDCTITLENTGGIESAPLAVPAFTIDTTPPSISETTAVAMLSNGAMPGYVFNSDEVGTISYPRDCSSSTTDAIDSDNTIIFNTLTDGRYEPPGGAGDFECTITVTDLAGNPSELSVTAFTVDTTAPVVEPIDMQTVSVGSMVTVTATVRDRAGATLDYVWSQRVGDTNVMLNSATGTAAVAMTSTATISTTFTAPAIDSDLEFTLTVTDDAGNPPASGSVTIEVRTFVVSAGVDRTVRGGAGADPVMLTATSVGLTDPTYLWSQTSGAPMVTFTTVTDTATVTFTAPNSDAVLEFEVEVTSGAVPRGTSTVTITVDATAPTLAPVSLAEIPLTGTGVILADPILINSNPPQYIFSSNEAGNISYPADCIAGTTPTTVRVMAGTHTITFDTLEEGRVYTGCTVTVSDAVGNFSSLTVPNFTVDTTMPTVDTITATAGSYGIGQTIDIQVIFTEPVMVAGSGTPVLLLNNNGGQAVYSSGSGSSTLTFNYEVSPSQGTASLDVLNDDALSLAGASINDLSGNEAVPSLAGTDTDGLEDVIIIAPGVILVSGDSGSYRAGDEVTIRVQFSEEVMILAGGDLQLTLETGDVDRMAEFSMLTTTATVPPVPNNTLVFTYRVEEGDRSQDLAYTAINALVAIGGTRVTSTIGDDVILTLPELRSANSLAGSSEIVIGVLLEEQNARLNEILLPKIAQAMSAATVDAITRRIESGGGDGQASLSSGLSSAVSSGISDVLPSGLASLKDLDLSWLKSFAYDFLMDKAEQSARNGSIDLDNALGSGFDIKGMLGGFDIKRMLGNSEFVMPLNASGDGTGSSATSNMVLWGSGDYNNLSDNDDGLNYDGDIYSINVGIDSQISQETLLGISVNWSNADFDYRDATTAQSGDYGYQLYGINPYISWSPQGLGGSNLWATVGYGIGEIENQIEGIEKVETDTRQYQFSGGGRYILTSNADQSSQLSIKGDLTLLRVDIDRSAGFLGNDVDSQSFRLLLQGSRLFDQGSYSLASSLEGGLRYDLGDGETGGGIELSPAFTYKSSGDHILIEGRGRYLIAGQHDQWGLSVLARIDQARHGRGLSFSMHPTWGQSQAQAQQLTAYNGSRFNDYRAAKAEAQMKTELSYGMHMSHILGQTMLFTPYAEFTLGENARYYQFGQRLSIGELLSLSFKLSHHQRRGYADDNHLGLESAINF